MKLHPEPTPDSVTLSLGEGETEVMETPSRVWEVWLHSGLRQAEEQGGKAVPRISLRSSRPPPSGHPRSAPIRPAPEHAVPAPQASPFHGPSGCAEFAYKG